MPQISLDWNTLKTAYPARKTGWIKAYMDELGPGNTPCCVQMSHALNVAGADIESKSNRRHNPHLKTPEGSYYYLLAVDEMKWFLEENFGEGEEISLGKNNKRVVKISDMMAVLNGRTGILVFSNLHYGTHTELWNVDHLHQRDMSLALFNCPRVLFWDVMQTAVA
jgi:type VI secretion system (T6SS) effector Tae4 (amidase)